MPPRTVETSSAGTTPRELELYGFPAPNGTRNPKIGCHTTTASQGCPDADHSR